MQVKHLKLTLATFGTLLAAMLISVLLGSGLFSCSDSSRGIKIATKPMTEQFILGEMLALLIEQDTNLEVELFEGVGGGTAHIHPAMVQGDFDIYPEYSGTAWAYVLKYPGPPPVAAAERESEALMEQMSHEYEQRYDLTWVGMYGFNNSYGLAVRKELADRLNLRRYSDLAPISLQLRFGAEYDFYEREDGYDALCALYGFKFGSRRDMDLGLKYQAIAGNEVDVINVFTTDGQLSEGLITVLEDDKHFYPTYYCGTVVRVETLEKHPELKPILMKMNGLLTDADMSRLNYEVDVKKRQPREVAREFLTQKKLLRG